MLLPTDPYAWGMLLRKNVTDADSFFLEAITLLPYSLVSCSGEKPVVLLFEMGTM